MTREREYPEVYVRYFGGLGNQLFQYNYSKHLENKFGIPVKMLRSRTPIRSDRQFELDEFLEFRNEDTHFPPFSLRTRSGPFASFISNRLERIKFRNIDYQNRPFSAPELDIDKSRKALAIAGYHQTTSLVEDGIGRFEADLVSFLDPISNRIRDKLDLPFDSTIVHVRIGDLLHAVNGKVGVLAPGFYSSVFEKLEVDPSSAIIITDDLKGAQSLAKELGVMRVISPQEANPWQSLAIFSTSRKLVCSNSTLSWWGGFLSQRRGSIVAMPEQWFKTEELGPGADLHINGALLVESNFQNEKGL